MCRINSKKLYYLKLILIVCLLFTGRDVVAQSIPSVDEDIPYLVTFGNEADKTWGDDDFIQVFFFAVPEDHKEPVYIRIFDPDVGGDVDEINIEFNTKTRFSIYGGKGAHSEPDAQKPLAEGNFKSGILLNSKTFGEDEKWDGEWYSFGPFNPTEGELQPEYGGYIFKLVVEGVKGDDGNLYKLFLSGKTDQNVEIEGGNAFAYSYCCRLWPEIGKVSHLYPFMDENVVSIKIHTFDYDNAGTIRVVSVAKKGEQAEVSKDGDWAVSKHEITEEELNTSLDVQIINQKPVRNNNVVLYITNQYGKTMPFYTVPIGGVPRFKYKIGVRKSN